VSDIAADAQELIPIQATDDVADHRGHNPGGAGHPEVRGLLHQETHLGQPQRLEVIGVHPSVGQFHYEIAQRAAILGGVWGLLQGLQQLERLGVEFFGIAEAQGGGGEEWGIRLPLVGLIARALRSGGEGGHRNKRRRVAAMAGSFPRTPGLLVYALQPLGRRPGYPNRGSTRAL